MADQSKLYLIDGSGYVFRAYHGIRNLSNSKGFPTNALYGFTKMLLALLKKERPGHAAVAFDTADRGERIRLYPKYKANRPPAPPDLKQQFERMGELVRAFNIPAFHIPGFEADDVIATLVKRAQDWGLAPVVVSADKDLMQLVSDQVEMLDPMGDRVIGPKQVFEKFGVMPERLNDLLALAGDSSDNIPGVPGIGVKTAAAYLTQFGTLESLLDNHDQIRGKKGLALKEGREVALLSKELVRLRDDVDLTISPDDLKLGKQDEHKLRALFEEFEFTSLLRELDSSTGTHVIAEPTEPKQTSLLDSSHRDGYGTLFTLEAITEAVTKARKAGCMAFDTETTSREPMNARLVGVSLAWAHGEAYYIPLAHYYLGVPEQPDQEKVLALLRPLLEDGGFPKYFQNAKYDDIVLRKYGIQTKGIVCDTMLASYLLNPDRQSHGLDALARDFLGLETIPYAKVVDAGDGTGKKTAKKRLFSEVEIHQATPYAAEDADICLRLVTRLEPLVGEEGLDDLLTSMELPLAGVLATMEMNGVAVDTQFLGELSKEFGERLETLEAEIHQLAGSPFLINSPKQLGRVLFEELGLPARKKTKTGYSTDVDVLEGLRYLHKLPELVLQYRSIAKLKSTYADALPDLINRDTGRIHTSFNQTVTATGRLSSSNPNLQNIPIRTSEGRRIREAFVAAPGFKLLSADYSQIELRVLAHLSEDPVLISAFSRGEDVHARTASEVFGVLPGLVSPEQRRAAKAINFGIVYGMSAFRLARDLGIARNLAQRYMDNYFSRYAKVASHLNAVVEQAKVDGFVKTLFGRRRFLPDLNASNAVRRSQAERMALNTPIQGAAADIIKVAMINLARNLEQARSPAKLCLQVHDELILEVPEGHEDQTRELLVQTMEEAVELSVPLKVDVSVGLNWAQAH